MWVCSRCQTEIDEEFQICWNCGATIEGTPDPSFERAEATLPPSAFPLPPEVIAPPTEEHPQSPRDLDSLLAEHFRCPKCRNLGASTKRIAATGTGLSKILDIQHNEFIAVSCVRCGYTELYNPDILERKKVLGSVLDVLFG